MTGRLPDEVEQRPLEQPVQALAARIDDAGLAQDREQGRGLRDGPLRAGQRRAEHRLDVVVVFRGLHGGRGRLADDGQDRALDRLRHRAVRGPGALRHRVGEVEAVEPAFPAEPVGHAPEDLARDDPRVAPRAHERAEADRGGDPVGRLAGDRLRLVERGLDRRVHVRAGVAVGDRVDVEAVDLVDVRLEVRDGGAERAEQAVPVAGTTGHLGDVRAAVGEVARAKAGRQRRRPRWQGAIGRDVQAVDVDRDPRDLLAERLAEGVAHGRIDLARDLRDGHAEGDRQVEVDLDAVVEA